MKDPWQRDTPKPKLTKGEETAGLGWILVLLCIFVVLTIVALEWTGVYHRSVHTG